MSTTISALVVFFLATITSGVVAFTIVIENHSTDGWYALVFCHKYAGDPAYFEKIGFSLGEVATFTVPDGVEDAFCLYATRHSRLGWLYDGRWGSTRKCKDKCLVRVLDNGFNWWNNGTKSWELLGLKGLTPESDFVFNK